MKCSRLNIVSMALDERNADDKAASRAIYRHQRELRKKLIGVYQQTSINRISQNNAFPFEREEWNKRSLHYQRCILDTWPLVGEL